MDKQIKLVFVVDNSIDQAKLKIEQLVKVVEKLAAVSQQAAPILAGMGGAGGPGLSIGTQHAQPGAGSGVLRPTQTGGGPLVQAVNATVGGVQKSAKAGVDAFKDLNTAFKSFVSLTDGNVQRIVGLLSRVHMAFSAVSALGTMGQRWAAGRAGAAGGPAAAAAAGVAGAGVAGGGPVTPSGSSLAGMPLGSLINNTIGTTRNGMWLGQHALPYVPVHQQIGGAGFFGNIAAAYQGGPNIGVGGGIGTALAGARTWAGQYGMAALGTAGAGVGIALGLGALAYGGYGQARGTELNSMRYNQTQLPFYASSRQAALGQIYGGGEQRLWSGDLAYSAGLTKALQTDAFKSTTDGRYRQARLEQIKHDFPVSYSEAAGEGFGALATHAIRDTLFEFGSTADYWFNKDRNYGAGIGVWYDRQRAENGLPVEIAQAQQRMIEEAIAANPVFMSRVQELSHESLGKTAALRGGFYGGGLVLRKARKGVIDPRTKVQELDTWVDQYTQMDASANAAGFTVNDTLGMAGQIAGHAGRKLAHALTGQMLQATSGGFMNAPQMFALGSQFNGGGAAGGGAFFRHLQNMISTTSTGLDPITASHVFGLGGQAMMSGGFTGGGAGLMQSLAEAAYRGTPGGDMLAAQALANGGFAAYGGFTTGSASGWQRALNYSAAINTGPKGAYSNIFLAEMDPAMRLDLSKLGDKDALPQALADRGLSLGDYRSLRDETHRTMFSRVVTSELDSGRRDVVEEFKRNGGFGYLAGKTSAERNKILGQLATALADSDGQPVMQAMSKVYLAASEAGVLATPFGGGSHSSTRGDSIEAINNKLQAKRKELLAKEKAGENPAYLAVIQGNIDNLIEQQRAAQAIQASSGTDPMMAIEGIEKALTVFVQSLRREASEGKGRAGPPNGGGKGKGKGKGEG